MDELDVSKVHVLIAKSWEVSHVSQDSSVLLGAPHPTPSDETHGLISIIYCAHLVAFKAFV